MYLVSEDLEVTSKCCDVLKKDPVKKFEKETGLLPIMGTTVEESNLRKQQYIKSGGCSNFDSKRPKCKPLSIFKKEDVWEYVKKNNLSICPIYYDQEINGISVKAETRTGCAYCGFGVQFEDKDNTKFHRLRVREPKRWASMMDKLGYRKALATLGITFENRHND